MHASLYGRGTVLHPLVTSPKYDSSDFTDVPYLEAVSVYNEELGEITVFAVNRHLSEGMELSVDLRSFGPTEVIQHTVMEHEDLQAANTKLHPGNVLPHDRGTAVAGTAASPPFCPKLRGM